MNRTSSLGRLAPLALSLILTAACASAPEPSPVTGAYRFEDGRLMAISHSSDKSFRYRDLQSGASGRLYPSGGLDYHSGTGWSTESPVTLNVRFHQEGPRVTGLDWKPKDEPERKAERLPLPEEEIRFRSGDLELYGKLVLPAEGEGPFPVVVLVHGSESDAATLFHHRQYQFPANGVAAFVYDKRGTGKSQGKFTMQFDLLAGDANAAVERLRRHPKIDPERIGLAGYSQGGWVAPLAAAKNPHVKFVVVGYGMLESPSREDRLETLNALRARGFGEAEVRKATEIIDAVDRLIRSDLNEGWDELGALKKKYGGEPWFGVLRGYVSGQVMRYPPWIMKVYGRKRLRAISWYYDSFETMEKLDIPMLWVLGGKDISAPNEDTIAELERLRAAGKPIDLKIYPDADHGILEFEEKDGERVYTHYSPGYFELESEWVRKQGR
jgi:hypothetical protein